MVRGSCLCGDLAWEADGPFEIMSHCHCSLCRKADGAAFATAVGAKANAFRWQRGRDARVARFASSPGGFRCFCPRCGSVAPNATPDGPYVFLPAGCLDDNPSVRQIAHIFSASKAPWHEITDALPRHDEYPPGWGDAVPDPALLLRHVRLRDAPHDAQRPVEGADPGRHNRR